MQSWFTGLALASLAALPLGPQARHAPPLGASACAPALSGLTAGPQGNDLVLTLDPVPSALSNTTPPTVTLALQPLAGGGWHVVVRVTYGGC